jgi:hypothetical protein
LDGRPSCVGRSVYEGPFRLGVFFRRPCSGAVSSEPATSLRKLVLEEGPSKRSLRLALERWKKGAVRLGVFLRSPCFGVRSPGPATVLRPPGRGKCRGSPRMGGATVGWCRGEGPLLNLGLLASASVEEGCLPFHFHFRYDLSVVAEGFKESSSPTWGVLSFTLLWGASQECLTFFRQSHFPRP